MSLARVASSLDRNEVGSSFWEMRVAFIFVPQPGAAVGDAEDEHGAEEEVPSTRHRQICELIFVLEPLYKLKQKFLDPHYTISGQENVWEEILKRLDRGDTNWDAFFLPSPPGAGRRNSRMVKTPMEKSDSELSRVSAASYRVPYSTNTDSDDDSVRVRWAENPSSPRRDLGMLSEASSTNDGHDDTDADADAEDN